MTSTISCHSLFFISIKWAWGYWVSQLLAFSRRPEMLRNLGFILESGKPLFLGFWPFHLFLLYLFPSALSYPVPPYLLLSAVSRLVLPLISFPPPHCIVTVCFPRQPLSALWDLSLKSRYLPFLTCRESSCLAKPSWPLTTMEVLFYLFPYLYGFSISPPLSCKSVSISLASSFSLAADPPFSPHVPVPQSILSYCFVCFLFMKFWLHLLEQAGPCTSLAQQIVLTYSFLSLCPAFDLHWTDFCPLHTKWRKLPLCV